MKVRKAEPHAVKPPAAAAMAALLLAQGTAAEARDPDSRLLSRRTVASVKVEAIAESDGGRLVRLRRKGPGYAFEYHLAFWRGNGGVVSGATFRRGECRSGDADVIQPTGDAMAKSNIDDSLADYLRECPLTRESEAGLRRSLDAAWPAFSALAERTLAATEAENEAIADYGKEE